MHLNARQLKLVGGKSAPEQPDPMPEVFEQLAALKTMLLKLPIPQPPNLAPVHADATKILDRIMRLEAAIIALARPVSYTFDIERDSKGKMIRVVAK